MNFNQDAYIYGNGYIARRFYSALSRMGLAHKIQGFVVTAPQKGEKGLNGRNILAVDKLPCNAKVWIATHEVALSDIEKTLARYGINDHLWVHPFLLALELGRPIQTATELNVDDIFRNMAEYYNPAIYYLTARQYIDSEEASFDIYIKAQSRAGNVTTAKRRAEEFKRLIDNCRRRGFQSDVPIKTNEMYRFILDGNHRAVLAKLFHAKMIKADIYSCTEDQWRQIDGKWLICEKQLKNVFLPTERFLIKSVDAELRGVERD